MPATALPNDATWRPWADLPLDLLRDISRRLHAAGDYASFHATCALWHDTLPPPPHQPAFLPWLLSPPDSSAANRRRARCVFSSSASSRGRATAATDIFVRDRRWVVSPEDGTAASTLTTAACPESSGDLLLTGSASPVPLHRFPSDEENKLWQDHAVATLCSDGTICAHAIGAVHGAFYVPGLNVTLQRPGCAAWTVVWRHMSVTSAGGARRCVAYHDGKIILCNQWGTQCIDDDNDDFSWSMPWEYSMLVRSHHLLQSRGELLMAHVLVNRKLIYTNDHHGDLGPRYCSVDSFAKGLSVSVHALQVAEGGEPQWVKRDDRSLADRVMFLGHPSSFAVDAARFGDSSGGCAYFVRKNRLFGDIRCKSALERCRVFRYNFLDGKSEFIEQLPAEWTNEACMWLTPQPSFASTQEIRERLEDSHRRAAEPLYPINL
ncbi:unnamed protein product [Urochloa humidicola]